MTRLALVLVLALLGALSRGAPDPAGTFRLRVGPFFEYGSREGVGMTRLAVRPFFAWERAARHPVDRDLEVVWPLSHFGWRGDAFHWRVVMMFWNEEDRTGRASGDYSRACKQTVPCARIFCPHLSCRFFHHPDLLTDALQQANFALRLQRKHTPPPSRLSFCIGRFIALLVCGSLPWFG